MSALASDERTGVAAVGINGLTKRFRGKPPTTAVDSVDLQIEPGEFVVLLGPSGCGKTTMLRCLAGLETADAGRIQIGSVPVFDAAERLNVPPEKRRIGMVFQSYALWPHMTVRRNIAYPLKVRRNRKALAAGWVEAAAELVECGELLDRYPAQLSGGQQQRVALARGLVARPDLMLLDEPLSNLDARLRDQVRSEVHQLHRSIGFTAVFVTHDQSEALALADRLAVMRAGAIEQFDTPEAVFESPATEYVARFIGLSNRVALSRSDGVWSCGDHVVVGDVPSTASPTLVARARPEDVTVCPLDAPLADQEIGMIAEVLDRTSVGRSIEVALSVGGTRLRAFGPPRGRSDWLRSLQPGDPVRALMSRSAARFFDGDGRPVPTVGACVTDVSS